MRMPVLFFASVVSVAAWADSGEPISVDDLPPFIVNAVAQDAPDATITDATLFITKSKQYYKIDATVVDLDIFYHLYLYLDGTLAKPIQVKGAVSPNKLPANIISAVASLTGGAMITSAKEVSSGSVDKFRIWARTPSTRFFLVLNADGTLNKPIHTEAKTAAADLPAPVLNALNNDMPNATVALALKISDGDATKYRITGTSGATTFTVTYSPEGGTVVPLHSETPVLVSALPAAVQSAIIQNVSSATVVSAIQIVDGGTFTYRIKAVSGNMTFILVLGADGSLLQPMKTITRAPDPADLLPPAVVAAIQQQAPGAVVIHAKLKTKGSTSVYTVVAITNTARYTFVLNADGTLAKPIHIEDPLDVGDLPASIVQAAEGAVHGGMPVNAILITDGTRSIYHVTVAANGKTDKLVIDVGGTVLSIHSGKW